MDLGEFERLNPSFLLIPNDTSQMFSGSKEMAVKSRVLIGNEYNDYSWKAPFQSQSSKHLYHRDVMNYGRFDPHSIAGYQKAVPNQCIMCGRSDVIIPTQNKNICKFCDSSFWLHIHYKAVFKFCKGCKNFFFLEEFTDKPRGTKCEKCRERGKELYHLKKAAASGINANNAPPLIVNDEMIGVEPSIAADGEPAAKRRRIRPSTTTNTTTSTSSSISSSSNNGIVLLQMGMTMQSPPTTSATTITSTPSYALGTTTNGNTAGFATKNVMFLENKDKNCRPPRRTNNTTSSATGMIAGIGATDAPTPIPEWSTPASFSVDLPAVTFLSQMKLTPSYSTASTITPDTADSNADGLCIHSLPMQIATPLTTSSTSSSMMQSSETDSATTTTVTPTATTTCRSSATDTTASTAMETNWQWDPSVNPLMQLALLTSSSIHSPLADKYTRNAKNDSHSSSASNNNPNTTNSQY
jgi:hypothetical protein